LTASLFFIAAEKAAGPDVVMEGAELRHLRAARIQAGQTVWLFDEEGTRIRAEVEAISSAAARLRILERERPRDARLRLTLVQSVLKNKAMDEVIEGAAEWGVRTVIPVSSERTVVKFVDREERKMERWMQVARAAAEQCKSGRVPQIAPPRRLASLLADPPGGRLVVLSEHGGRALKDILAEAPVPPAGTPDEWVLLLGPEGGWAEKELEAIAAAGFEAASLGPQILRAGTAALSAAAILLHQRGI
jgi:16S rRNA (uracil1498-N3)-methyltransferase